NVLVRGMQISNAFLTTEIQETVDFKEYKTVFMKISVPLEQPQPIVSTQGTYRSTPGAIRSPTLTASPRGRRGSRGEKRVKIHKASKSSKSARGYSSKHSTKDSTTYVSKQQQQQQEWDAWVEETVIDENEFKNAEEYAYHLEQTTNFMKNQIVWESKQEDIRRPVPRPLISLDYNGIQINLQVICITKILFFLKHGNTKEKKYILSLYKIHAERFPEVDLEEKMNRWVRKEFKTLTKTHVDKPTIGLIYLNSKDEKRVMYLIETMKFCNATLEKVLKEIFALEDLDYG
nr:hypothetical protein [Tanacetum cinerariifolium]